MFYNYINGILVKINFKNMVGYLLGFYWYVMMFSFFGDLVWIIRFNVFVRIIGSNNII